MHTVDSRAALNVSSEGLRRRPMPGDNIATSDEDFDPLHDFRGPPGKEADDSPFRWGSLRGYANAGVLLLLLAAIVGLFMAWPVAASLRASVGANTSGYNLGGVNATGQYPETGLPHLIDSATPTDARTKMGYDGHEWDLVFSDEFNTEGRTFYPGDDPYWEAMDIHYWATK